MKRASEAEFGQALRRADISGLYVYRPPDAKTGAGVSNWKPCDFMAWAPIPLARALLPGIHTYTRSFWFEAKDCPRVNYFPFDNLRPAQLAGIHAAHQAGIPYWLAIFWRRAKAWTISDAWRVLEWWDQANAEREPDTPYVKSISRELLMSRFGVDSSPANLGQTLKSVILGEVE